MPTQSLNYEIIRILLSGVLEAMMAMTLARVLTMRSNKAFYIAYAIDFIVDAILKQTGTAPLIRAVVFGLFCWLGIPILMSTGDLRKRATRTAVVTLGVFLSEALGSTIYSLISGGPLAPQEIGPSNLRDVISVYLILIVMEAIIFGAITAIFARIDGKGDSHASLPTTLLLMGSVVCFSLIAYKTPNTETETLSNTLLFVLYCWLALVGSAVVLAVARSEAASQREAAEAALTARRVRHTKGEVEALAHRAAGMGSLRHALANDVRAVRRLAEAGDVTGADRRLAELQEQARVLDGSRDGQANRQTRAPMR